MNYGGTGQGTYGGSGTVIGGTSVITGGNTWFVPSGGASGTAVSAPSDTNEDILATTTLPPLSSGAAIRVTSFWTITNSANNKTARVRLGGIGGTIMAAVTTTTNGVLQLSCLILNRQLTNSQVAFEQRVVGSSVFQANGAASTAAIDTSVSTTLVLTAQKALNTETMTLEGYLVELLKP